MGIGSGFGGPRQGLMPSTGAPPMGGKGGMPRGPTVNTGGRQPSSPMGLGQVFSQYASQFQPSYGGASGPQGDQVSAAVMPPGYGAPGFNPNRLSEDQYQTYRRDMAQQMPMGGGLGSLPIPGMNFMQYYPQQRGQQMYGRQQDNSERAREMQATRNAAQRARSPAAPMPDLYRPPSGTTNVGVIYGNDIGTGGANDPYLIHKFADGTFGFNRGKLDPTMTMLPGDPSMFEKYVS